MHKLILIILVAAVFSFSCKREKKGIDDIFSEYERQDGVSMIKLPPALFLALLQKNENVPDLSIDNIDLVRFLTFNKTGSNNLAGKLILKEITSDLDGLKFEDLLRYSKSGYEVVVKILETGEYISDLIVIINDNENPMVVGVSGKFKTDDITRLASEIDFNSFKGIQLN
jgi:hypothetical protein